MEEKQIEQQICQIPQVYMDHYMPDVEYTIGHVRERYQFDLSNLDLSGETGYQSDDWKSFVRGYATTCGYNPSGDINRLDLVLQTVHKYESTKQRQSPLLAADQSSSFHHCLRTGAIAGKELRAGDSAILGALAHNLFDRKGYNGSILDTDEVNIRQAEILTRLDNESADELLRQSRWMDLLESVGDTFTNYYQSGITPDLHKELGEIERNITKVKEANNFETSTQDIELIINELEEQVKKTFTGDDGNITDHLVHIFAEAQSLMVTESGRIPLMILTANLIDNLRYPGGPVTGDTLHAPVKNPFVKEDDEYGSEILSQKTLSDIYIADGFFIPCLEIHSPRGLRVLKELTTSIMFPRQYALIKAAAEELSSEEGMDFFDSRTRGNSLVTKQVEKFMEQKGLKQITWKEVMARTKEWGDHLSFDLLLQLAPQLLRENEFVISTSRRKGVASCLDKIRREWSSYANYISANYYGVKEGSLDWYKLAINLINDINAFTIITGNYVDKDDEGGRRQYAYDLSLEVASYLQGDPNKEDILIPTMPYTGVLQGKYKGPLDVEKLAIRVYNRTEEGQDGYFNIAHCFEAVLDNNWRTAKGEIQIQPIGDYLVANMGDPAHFFYKMKRKFPELADRKGARKKIQGVLARTFANY